MAQSATGGERAFLSIGLLVSLSLVAATTTAKPLSVRHGRDIRVEIGAKHEEAVALRASAGGWRVDFGPTATNSTLALRDVTAGVSSGPRFELKVIEGGVTLDATRFRADHAYRVELRRGTIVIGDALIYLSPPRRSHGPVVFDEGDATGKDDDGSELQSSDKGTL